MQSEDCNPSVNEEMKVPPAEFKKSFSKKRRKEEIDFKKISKMKMILSKI